MRSNPDWSPPDKGDDGQCRLPSVGSADSRDPVNSLRAWFPLIILAKPGAACPLCRTQAITMIGGPSFTGNLMCMLLPILVILVLVAGVHHASRSWHVRPKP